MTPGAIAISIGPSLMLSPKIRNDPQAFLAEAENSQRLIIAIIDNAMDLFGVNFEKEALNEEASADRAHSQLTAPNKETKQNLPKPVERTSSLNTLSETKDDVAVNRSQTFHSPSNPQRNEVPPQWGSTE